MSQSDSGYSWERLNRKTLVDSKFIKVYEDTVRLPESDTVIDDYTVVSLNNPVLIVAVDALERVLIMNEYRYAQDQVMTSLPAGAVDAGETPVQAAERELLEETGYTAKTFEYVGELNEYPTKLDHITHVVLANGIEKVKDPHYEITEHVEKIELIEAATVLEMAKTNKIKTAVIVAALYIALEQ